MAAEIAKRASKVLRALALFGAHLFAFLLFATQAHAGQETLAWDANNSTPGSYSVTLTATGPGGSDAQSNANMITAAASVASPAAGATDSAGGSGGGGGCTVGIAGTGTGVDPVLPAMLLMGGCYFLRRRSVGALAARSLDK